MTKYYTPNHTYYTAPGSYDGLIKFKGKWIRVTELNRINKTGWTRWQGPPNQSMQKALKSLHVQTASSTFPDRVIHKAAENRTAYLKRISGIPEAKTQDFMATDTSHIDPYEPPYGSGECTLAEARGMANLVNSQREGEINLTDWFTEKFSTLDELCEVFRSPQFRDANKRLRNLFERLYLIRGDLK